MTTKPSQMAGLILWRAGLLLMAGWGLFESLQLVFRFFRLPLQLEIGFGLVIAGAVAFVASLIVERFEDRKLEHSAQTGPVEEVIDS